MLPPAKLSALYVSFAALSGAVNLSLQWAVLRLWPFPDSRTGLAVLAALACGTGAGFVVKYVLDKRYIFEDRSTGTLVHARKFFLYSTMGVGTTAIFWGAELTSNWIDPGGRLLYVGGALGLAVGYVVKYQLDRRFVFRTRL